MKLMTDKRSVELYLNLKLLQSGSEKKRDIRLVVVGKKGAGKTSLIKRLFGEDNTDVTSTNGIEIHKIKCKAKSDDGIWNKLDASQTEGCFPGGGDHIYCLTASYFKRLKSWFVII
ncbi:Hypothetical predicted protein [Mytilus galloprovincialis]|uniref:Uncharacterized protein n=1 Tax=Mytilus galloprovincialis TaxID=29158 RepID=A0A8B6GGW4_MYTGA|nr:Hypothetical predicted protein [Mytilus galloprovincialis]